MFKTKKESNGDYKVIGRFDMSFDGCNRPIEMKIVKVRGGWQGKVVNIGNNEVIRITKIIRTKKELLGEQFDNLIYNNKINEY